MIKGKKRGKLLNDPAGFFLESRHPLYRYVASFYARRAHRAALSRYRAQAQKIPVSVIMAAYNAERWIDDAIASLLGQTHPPAEIILIDDASTDSTRAKIKDWQARDARIKAYGSDINVGPYVCKNFGLYHAAHNIVAFADADDISQPERLAAQLGALSHQNRVACLCRRLNCAEDMSALSDKRSHGTAMASLMFKKDTVLERAGYLDTVRFAADAEFTDRLRTLYGRGAVYTLPAALYHVRRHDASITRAGPGRHLWHDDKIEKNPLRAAYHTAYENWHASLGRNKENHTFYTPYAPLDGASFPLPNAVFIRRTVHIGPRPIAQAACCRGRPRGALRLGFHRAG